MSEDATRLAMRTAACIAFLHIDEVGEHEREQVLIALVELLPEAQGAIAQQTLFHFREERRLQMQLAGILDRRDREPK